MSKADQGIKKLSDPIGDCFSRRQPLHRRPYAGRGGLLGRRRRYGRHPGGQGHNHEENGIWKLLPADSDNSY
jgi:hypothetical protein